MGRIVVCSPVYLAPEEIGDSQIMHLLAAFLSVLYIKSGFYSVALVKYGDQYHQVIFALCLFR